MSDESSATDLERLFGAATELSSYGFQEGDVPVLARTGGGTLVKIPERMVGKAAAEGLAILGEQAQAATARKLRVQEEQSGAGAAIVAGTEEALGTATFGLTDAAMMGLAIAAGKTKEQYLQERAERQEGSPIASGIGSAIGFIAPALLTEGLSVAADAGIAAKAGAKAVNLATAPMRGVMAAGKAAAVGAEALAERLLPASVLTAEELGAAYQAARVAGSTVAAPGVRAVAATALRTGAERAAAGAVEGALFGAGQGIREQILGSSDSVAESILHHAGADALLFGKLGGGLGVLEAGLPLALSTARKITNAAYDKLPVFGRDTLRAKWAAEPAKTGVLAETAEELFAQRARLVDLDERFSGVLDSLAATSPEAVRQASSHVDALEALAQSPRKGLIDTVLRSPDGVREELLKNATALVDLDARAKGAVDFMLASTPEKISAAFSDSAAFSALASGNPKMVGRLLELNEGAIKAALDNVPGISALEQVTKNKALASIAMMPEEIATWYVQNAGRIATMESRMPGYWRIFSRMTRDADSTFAVTQAEDILSNWRESLSNVRERSRVETEVFNAKRDELAAGEELSKQLYQTARLGEDEAFLKIGEIGGPPSLEGIQNAVAGIAERTAGIAEELTDAVRFDSTIAAEIAGTAKAMRRDFIGDLTEKEFKEYVQERAAKLKKIGRAPEDMEAFAGEIEAEMAAYRESPRAAFDRVKEYRQDVAAWIDKLGKKVDQTPKDILTLQKLKELRADITSTYHDATVWGDAAKIRAQADDAFRQWKASHDIGGLFDQKFMQTIEKNGQKVRVLNPTRINLWLNQMGEFRTAVSLGEEIGSFGSAWTGVSDAFLNLVKTTEELLPKITRSATEIDPESLKALAQKTLDATAEFQRRGLYTRELFQMRALNEAGEAASELNLIGLPKSSPGLGGFPHGVPTGLSMGPESFFGLPRGSAEAGVASELASVAPGGAAVAKGVSSLLSIPTMQRQVTSRIRGMVAIEKMGQRLADGIEEGARWLIGQATGKKIAVGAAYEALTQSKGPSAEESRKAREDARRAAAREDARRALEARAARERGEAPPSRASAPPAAPPGVTPQQLEQDRMIRDAHRLASDPTALASLIEQQSHVMGRELPETAAAVARVIERTARIAARAAPVPEGQPLDSWQPSAADRAAFSRVMAAASRPLSLYARASDGTLTKEEVDTVAEVAPDTLAKMRAAAQAHVEAARVEGRSISAQNRRGIETLLGYPLTTGSAKPSIAKNQGVFGASRAGRSERPSDSMARPIPGAEKVTLGDRYLTPQQAAGAR